MTDPEGNTTAWLYDDLNRVTRETNQLGQNRYFTYNAAGLLTRRVDRLDRVREFEYDNLYRNTAEYWYTDETAADADPDHGSPDDVIAFAYDLAGQLSAVTDSTSGADYDFDYDLLGRVTSITQSIGGLTPTVVMAAKYDPAGRRTQLAASIGGTGDFLTDYAYDHLGRVDWIKQQGQSGNAVAEKYVDFAFDLASRPLRTDRYADLLGNDLVAVTDYLFDDAGRLTDLTHHDGATPTPTNFADYNLAYDLAGRIVDFDFWYNGSWYNTDTATGDPIKYDATGQLTDVDYAADWQADEDYDYDENGNRTNNGFTTAATDHNNQLLTDGTYRYTYDAEGNRQLRFVWNDANQNQQVEDSERSDLTEYFWDHRNRLTAVNHYPDNTAYAAEAPDQVVEYAYDFGNRWVRKIFNPGEVDEESTIFVYDGNQIALQFDKTGTGDMAASNLTHRYLWGTSVDQILADETVDDGGAEDVLWPLTDHLNTVRDLAVYDPQTDETTVTNHLVYNAFGELISGTNPTLFGFTARPFDPATGLQNNLHRWYGAAVGRWLSEDPSGFGGGDGNLLRYCGNCPTNWIDSQGLKKGQKGTKNANAILSALPKTPPCYWAVFFALYADGDVGHGSGHSWVAIMDTSKMTVTARGFGPDGWEPTNSVSSGKGIIGDDGGTGYTVARAYPISKNAYDAIDKAFKKAGTSAPQYDLQDYNCTTWVIGIMNGPAGLKYEGGNAGKSGISMDAANNDDRRIDYIPLNLAEFLLKDNRPGSILFDNSP